MQADHIHAWSQGGKTIEENCQMLCIKDHKLMKNKQTTKYLSFEFFFTN